MMFNKFTVFTLLAVTTLIASAVGHPTFDFETKNDGTEVEPTSAPAKHGLHAVLKKIKDKFVKTDESCADCGWIHRLKTKFGFTKTTATTTTTTTERPTTAEVDYSGYLPAAPVAEVAPQEGTDEGYAPNTDEDITILDDSVNLEIAAGDETAEVTRVPEYQADPEIDIRMRQ